MSLGFQFKQFYVHHDECAMKVGTDGVLLGALAEGGRRILDIGTGTGLCALMMAQRFENATITAIDIDTDACRQASQNIAESPFSERIKIVNAAFSSAIGKAEEYDSIISNPPYFEEELSCPDVKRNNARHTSSLPFSTLINDSKALLSDKGVITLIVPASVLSRIEEECAYANMFITKKIFICTKENKKPKRVVVYIRKHSEPVVSETQVLTTDGSRSAWYQDVTKNFYLSHTPSDIRASSSSH